MSLTRRRLLVSLGAGLVGTAFARRVHAIESVDVVVIGAGLAGLNAALILAGEGARVVVLEASERVGGRAWTGDRIPGRPELGASQIGALYARARDLCARLGVELVPAPPQERSLAYSVRDQLVAPADWEGSPLNLTEGAERAVPPGALLEHFIARGSPLNATDDWLQPEAARHDVSVVAWLRAQGASAEALRLVNEGLTPKDIFDTSMLTLLQESTRLRLELEAARRLGPDADPVMGQAAVKGGISRLPEAMSAKLGDAVRLRRIVAAIRTAAKGVDVQCLDGATIRCGHVIAAVPFTALRRVALTPALEGKQALAVSRLPYGETTRVYLAVDSAFWDQDGLPASLWSDGPVNVAFRFRGADGADYVMAQSTGKKAERLDQLPPDARGGFVVNELARLRPATKGKLRVVGAHAWAAEPFIAGCRHTYRPGEVREFAEAMIRPHGRLHFAGEHTRRLEIGMESALESGERAALEILGA